MKLKAIETRGARRMHWRSGARALFGSPGSWRHMWGMRVREAAHARGWTGADEAQARWRRALE